MWSSHCSTKPCCFVSFSYLFFVKFLFSREQSHLTKFGSIWCHKATIYSYYYKWLWSTKKALLLKMLHSRVVKLSKFFSASILDWIRGGTLSPVMEDHAMAWPLHLVMDTCNLAMDCSRHSIFIGCVIWKWLVTLLVDTKHQKTLQKVLVHFLMVLNFVVIRLSDFCKHVYLILIGYKEAHRLL